MRHGSLFSGVGGLDMAIERTFGSAAAGVSEFDSAPSRVLAYRWPGAPNIGDVTRVDWDGVEPVDLICGGSPCQDISAAGKRAGMTEGTRSNLWVEMREAIATIKPMFVVWENVRGALSATAASEEDWRGAFCDVESRTGLLGNGQRGPALRALGRVLGDLSALGYDTEWACVRASDVGACHQRVRVFVLAWRRDLADTESWRRRLRVAANLGPAGREIDAFGDADRIRPAVNLLRTVMADEDGGGALHPDVAAARGQTLRLTGQVLALTGDLLPSPVAQPSHNSPEAHLRKKPGRQVVTDLAIIVENGLLGTGGMLPTQRATRGGSSTETVQRLPTPGAYDAERGGSQDPEKRRAGGHAVALPDAVEFLPTVQAHDAQGGKTPEQVAAMRARGHGVSNLNEVAQWGRYAPAIAQHERVLGRPAPAPTQPSKTGRPQLAARFTEWMMMWPEGHVTDPKIWEDSGLSVPAIRNAQIKACGNGVVTPQAVAALRILARRALGVAA